MKKVTVRATRPGDVDALLHLPKRVYPTIAPWRRDQLAHQLAIFAEGQLVAELDGVLVGHVALSPVSISDGSVHWFGLGPISVLPVHQRRGVGSALMRAVLAALRQRGAHGCVLLGDPGYYGRWTAQSFIDTHRPLCA